MDRLWLKILIIWVVIDIFCFKDFFHFFLVTRVQPRRGLVVIKNLGHLGRNQNSIDNFPFFSSFFRSLHCDQGVKLVVTKNFGHSNGDQNSIYTFPHYFFFFFFLSMQNDQGVDWLWLKILVTWVMTKIRLTPFHLEFSFGCCTMTGVWTSYDWKSWLFKWQPKSNQHYSTINVFQSLDYDLSVDWVQPKIQSTSIINLFSMSLDCDQGINYFQLKILMIKIRSTFFHHNFCFIFCFRLLDYD